MRETPTAAGRDAMRQLRAEIAFRHDETTLRACGLDVPRRVAASSPAPRRRVKWGRALTWGAVAAVMLVWSTLLGWLLVQGVSWVLAYLP